MFLSRAAEGYSAASATLAIANEKLAGDGLYSECYPEADAWTSNYDWELPPSGDGMC